MFRNNMQSTSDVHQPNTKWRPINAETRGWESRKLWQPPPTLNILAVDENSEYRQRMKEALLLNGYTVYGAENGLEGCRILEGADIDLIISDLQMATFDGLKLRRFARQMDRYRNTKFVLISENREEYANVFIRDQKVDFFFDKRASMSDMMKFVDELMFGGYAGVWI